MTINDICFEREAVQSVFHLSFFLIPETLEPSKFLLPSFLFGLCPQVLTNSNTTGGNTGEILIFQHFTSPLLGILAPQGLIVLVVLQYFHTDVFLIFYPAFIFAFFKKIDWNNLLHYSLKKFLKIWAFKIIFHHIGMCSQYSINFKRHYIKSVTILFSKKWMIYTWYIHIRYKIRLHIYACIWKKCIIVLIPGSLYMLLNIFSIFCNALLYQ